MDKFILTDLGCELFENAPQERIKSVGKERLSNGILMEKLTLSEGEIHVGNESFVTFFSPRLWELSNEEFFILSRKISNELEFMVSESGLKKKDASKISILIAGIGNPYLNTDSLGSETVKNITATGHLSDSSLNLLNKRRIYAFAPDVTGNTGIETVELIKACVGCTDPDVLIAIDSLAAKSRERLATTVQISNSGIVPGSGIGNRRRALNRKTVGIPVISIGVPTVVSAATLIAEAIRNMNDVVTNEMGKVIDGGNDFFVTPKEIELLVKSASLLLANSINMLADMNNFSNTQI